MSESIGKALGRLSSGLFIVAAKHQDAQEGMLGSWVMQAGFEPPMVTVVFGKNRPILEKVEASGFFTLSVLGKDDGSLMKPFFQAPAEGQDQFSSLSTGTSSACGDTPYLADGLAWMGLKFVSKMESGDHVVVLGEVLEGDLLKEGEPKTHVRESGFKY